MSRVLDFAGAVPSAQGRVAVFDSGAGGLSVLKELARALPRQNFLYLGDQAHCPYGPRPANEIAGISLDAARACLAAGASMFVVACNTASAAALAPLREAFPTWPIVGMVPPVKPAATVTKTGKIAVLATPGTLAGGLLEDVIGRFSAGTDVRRVACPGWVEAIERGELDGEGITQLARAVLQPQIADGVDTLVLGCTHFPLLMPVLTRIAGLGVTLLDAGEAVARQAARVFSERGLDATPPAHGPRFVYVTTSDAARFGALRARLGAPDGVTMHATWR